MDLIRAIVAAIIYGLFAAFILLIIAGVLYFSFNYFKLVMANVQGFRRPRYPDDLLNIPGFSADYAMPIVRSADPDIFIDSGARKLAIRSGTGKVSVFTAADVSSVEVVSKTRLSQTVNRNRQMLSGAAASVVSGAAGFIAGAMAEGSTIATDTLYDEIILRIGVNDIRRPYIEKAFLHGNFGAPGGSVIVRAALEQADLWKARFRALVSPVQSGREEE